MTLRIKGRNHFIFGYSWRCVYMYVIKVNTYLIVFLLDQRLWIITDQQWRNGSCHSLPSSSLGCHLISESISLFSFLEGIFFTEKQIDMICFPSFLHICHGQRENPKVIRQTDRQTNSYPTTPAIYSLCRNKGLAQSNFFFYSQAAFLCSRYVFSHWDKCE